MIIRVCVIVSVVLCLSVIVDVVKVTQNWSLECKIDVCWKCKIRARFWLSLGAVWFVKYRRPNGGIRGLVLRNNIFQKRIFGVDLLQFYEGYLYYKYRLCISVNLEIEGAETRV